MRRLQILVITLSMIVLCACEKKEETYTNRADFSKETVSFTYSIDETGDGKTVLFKNTSSSGFGNFLWDFGDGNRVRSKDIVHCYAKNGKYNVTLYGWTKDEVSYQTSQVVTVEGNGLVYFEFSTNGRTVTFRNLSNDKYKVYSCDFGDDDFSWDRDPVHTYTKAGKYEIYLYAYENENESIFEADSYNSSITIR